MKYICRVNANWREVPYTVNSSSAGEADGIEPHFSSWVDFLSLVVLPRGPGLHLGNPSGHDFTYGP